MEEKAKTQEAGNILLCEFMGRKFKAYRDNESYNTEFDSFDACQKWIDENNVGIKGFSPHIGWNDKCGNYHELWGSLMLVVERIETLMYVSVTIELSECYIDWLGEEPEDIRLLNMLSSMEQIHKDSNSKISSTFNACVEIVSMYLGKEVANG